MLLRLFAIVFGIIIAAIGGVIAYRAYFLEPVATVVISNEGVRELPDTFRIVGGIALLVLGAAMAFAAAVRRSEK